MPPIRSSLTHLHGFQLLVLLPKFIEITFFRLYQQNKSSEPKVKLDKLVIVGKGFLKLPNLHMLLKQMSQPFPRNLALGTFRELLILFSAKVNLLYLLLLHLIKQNCLLKTSLKNLILMTQVSLYLFYLLELM